MIGGKLTTWLAVSLFLLVITSAANAKTIYVDADVSPGGGTSWANVYNYLQDTLADANTLAKPVEIRVAQGTYEPNDGNDLPLFEGKGATFALKNNMQIIGGYAGYDEPDSNARDIILYETILSGDLNEDDVPVVPYFLMRYEI